MPNSNNLKRITTMLLMLVLLFVTVLPTSAEATSTATATTTATTTIPAGYVEVDSDDAATTSVLLIDGSGSMRGQYAEILEKVKAYFGDIEFDAIYTFDEEVRTDLGKVTHNDTDIVGAIAEMASINHSHIYVATDGVQDPKDYSSLHDGVYANLDIHLLLLNGDQEAAYDLIEVLCDRMKNSSVTSYNLEEDGQKRVHADGYIRKTVLVPYADYAEGLDRLQEELEVLKEENGETLESVILMYLKANPEWMTVWFYLITFAGVLFAVVLLVWIIAHEDNRHKEKMATANAETAGAKMVLDKASRWGCCNRKNCGKCK